MAIDSLRERDRDCSAAFQCLIHRRGDHGAGDKQSPRLAGGHRQPCPRCSPHPAQLSWGAHGCGGAALAPRLAPTNLSRLVPLPGAGEAGRLQSPPSLIPILAHWVCPSPRHLQGPEGCPAVPQG